MVLSSRPSIPGRPVLGSTPSVVTGARPAPSILDAGNTVNVTSGRAALALALRHAGVRAGDDVLVPAYHCTALVEPVAHIGAQPVFYRIQPDTTADIDHLTQLLRPETRAMITVHYFGFPQPLTQLRRFCDEHRLVLIEDCAHAFFGQYAGRPLGSIGDYAIASAIKFFPIYDGGCLVSARHPLHDVSTRFGGALFEAKSLINALEHAMAHDRLRRWRPILRLPIRIKDILLNRWKAHQHDDSSRAFGPSAADGGYKMDADWIDKRMSLCSRLIMRHSKVENIAARRRAHYRLLFEGVRDLPGVRPLFSDLPTDVVPYLFPFFVDAADEVLARLRAIGVPALRFGEPPWPTMAAEVCPVSANLARHLLQLPCHQALHVEEIEWMVGRVADVLSDFTGAGTFRPTSAT